MKWGIVPLLVLVLCMTASGAPAADLTQTHDPLVLNVGLGGWGYDTGWMGVDLVFGGVYIKLFGNVGGTVLDVALNGQGKLTYPTGVNQGDLWFQGTTNGGVVSQDLGIELGGKYKIVVSGIPYEGNLPLIPNTDIRLADSETVTPYQLGNSVTLSDSIDNVNLYTYPIGVPNIFSGNIGVGISASDTIRVDFKELHTDKASFTADLQRKQVSVPDPTLTVGDIYENLGVVPSMTFTPNITVSITVLYITYPIITIPTFPITVPLSTLLNPEYATTPSRSIVFTIPPTVTSFAINNGASYTLNPNVNLNNTSTNSPSDYMASEDMNFAGAGWTPYDSAPPFVLSAGDGTKQVYFRTLNVAGESLSVSDTILLSTVHPTVNAQVTKDPSPALSGTVAVADAPVSVTVAGQTRTATNNGDGTWSLADNLLAPISQGTYDVAVTITDPVGNSLSDTTTGELTIDTTPPAVTVDFLATSDATPPLAGTVDDLTAAMSVTVDGQTHPAINHGDGTWTLPDDTLSSLTSGIYDVQAVATDTAGNEGHDATSDELTVDTEPPVVTVNFRVTKDTTPELTGSVSDLSSSTIVVTVGGQTRVATNNGDRTWTLPDDSLYQMEEGVYNVQLTATDVFGNVGHDTTTNELTIDTTPPTVTVTFRATNDTTPELTGTVNDGTATIMVSVSLQTWPAINYPGESRWTLPHGQLLPLAEGLYNVRVTATDPAGNEGKDTTSNELKIDLTPPTVGFAMISPSPTGMNSVAFRATFNESVTPSFNAVTLLGSLAGVATYAIAGPDPVYTVTITPNNPDANGNLGIRINAGTVTDVAGNPCAGGVSTFCFIQNWCGFGTHPQDARTYVGDAHTFTASVGCIGVAWAYQWKWDDGGKTVHDGPATPSWTMPNVTEASRGQYWCEVTYDGIPHTSEIATLDVEPPLAIAAQPEGGAMIPGESYTFSVLATGGYIPLHYQWEKNGTAMPEATDSSYSMPVLQEDDAGIYTVEITDDNGATVASAPANLTVSAGVPVESPAGRILLACACALAGIATLYARRRRSSHRPHVG